MKVLCILVLCVSGLKHSMFTIGRITSLVALSGVVSVRLSHDTTGDLRPCFLLAEPIGPF
jgi:hypothetical protein